MSNINSVITEKTLFLLFLSKQNDLDSHEDHCQDKGKYNKN